MQVKFNFNGQYLASGSMDGTVRVWTPEGQEVVVLEGPSEAINVRRQTPTQTQRPPGH
jgi:WD40 repeat protein